MAAALRVLRRARPPSSSRFPQERPLPGAKPPESGFRITHRTRQNRLRGHSLVIPVACCSLFGSSPNLTDRMLALSDTNPTDIRPKREAKRMLTRRRVLEAALQVFKEAGFEAAGTAEIARRAGVSHGTVFTVEPTKERLAVAAFGGQLRGIGEAVFTTVLMAAAPMPLVAQVEHVFQKLYDFYAEHHGVSRALMREVLLTTRPDGAGDHDQLLKEFLGGLEMMLRSAMLRGSLAAGTDITALAAALFGIYLLFLLALLNQVFPERETHQENLRQTLRATLHGHLTDPVK